jgi:hypothetical protein
VTSGPPAESADAAWAGYLDGLEAALSTLDGQLLDGRAPAADALGALSGLTPPASPTPARLLDRRALLLAKLHDVTGHATARRDAVASQLAALPHRRAPRRPDAPATLGGKLDITG